MLQNLPASDSSPSGGMAGFGLEATCFQRKYFVAVEMQGYESICATEFKGGNRENRKYR